HQELLRQLRQGDRVVTAGGMYGTVVGVSESVVTLRIAEGVKVEFQKASVAEKAGKEPE
ncbi:MAG: preprotein translocase subunit YajC, partial [Acidobacteria bacterium]|nr:preprotein translocase subunit YajC [Acidobacteriota bacterium]